VLVTGQCGLMLMTVTIISIVYWKEADYSGNYYYQMVHNA